MKSISQIFSGNEHLMDLGPVEELIDYTQELEGQVMDRNLDDTYDKEMIYLEMIRDIYNSCKGIEEQEMLHERYPKDFGEVNYKEVVINLKNYIMEMVRENRLPI
jgi:hypothetical protein